MDPSPSVSCTNCKQITDSTGKTVWICDHCGTENPVPTPSVIATSDVSPDAAAAQAAINSVLPNAVATPDLSPTTV